MNQQTKDQIAREAEAEASRHFGPTLKDQNTACRLSYIAGAETWAERGDVLKEALEKIVDLSIKLGEDATEIWSIADDALTKYADKK